MRIIIVRHGDPDYVNDTLTEKGWREAEMLAERLAKTEVTDFYVSPYGRAKDTASCTLQKMDRKAETLEWMREFEPRIHRPDRALRKTRVWDWLPADWTGRDHFYDYDHWCDDPLMRQGHVREEYDKVCQGLDALLAKHGYDHEGRIFRVTRSNHDTVCLFCHFGVEMVMLSHILQISPMPLWHGFAASPSSVTVLYSEERREGTAIFRIRQFGDLSHLYMHGEEPSFAARYAECFEDETLH